MNKIKKVILQFFNDNTESNKKKNHSNKKCLHDKLLLDLIKVNNVNTNSKGNYKINKQIFSNFIKTSNFCNPYSIYTKFFENIDSYSNGDFGGGGISIRAIQIDKLNRIYIGGEFNLIGNLVCSNIAMWDGTKWYNLDSGVNSEVDCLCIDSNNNLWVGGSFDIVGNITSKNIAKWNGINWVPIKGVDSNVSSILTNSNGDIIIGGYFNNSELGIPLNKIAKWNSTNWINIGPTYPIDNIYAMGIDKLDNIYIGGYFFPVSVYNSMGWSILKNNNGEELSQIINTIIIDPNTNNPIFGGIIGNFGTITNVFNVIKFDLSNNTWFPLNNSNGFGLNAQCNVLVYDKYNNRIIAGGSFSGLTDDGITSDNTLSLIASYDGTNWSPISNGINGSYVQTIGILNKGTTLIGGFINGSKNIYSNGLVIYTNNYVNIWWKKNLLYTLTDFNNKVTISARDIVQYVFEHSL